MNEVLEVLPVERRFDGAPGPEVRRPDEARLDDHNPAGGREGDYADHLHVVADPGEEDPIAQFLGVERQLSARLGTRSQDRPRRK